MNVCKLEVLFRYSLRIEAMLVKLEFGDKLAELKPAIQTLEEGITGGFRERGLDAWPVIVVAYYLLHTCRGPVL